MTTSNKTISKKSMYIILSFGLILGVIFYVLGFVILKSDEYPIWHEIMLTAGNVFVVGVAVGFITNVLQNFGLFKEELGTVLYAREFLAKRNDIREIWLNASKVVFEGKFPQIHGDFFARMFDYLQCKDVAYYNNYEMHLNLEWLSQEKNLVKVRKKIIFDLIAHSKKHQVYTYKSWLRLSPDSEYSSKIDILVNGTPPKPKTRNKENRGEE